MLVTILMFIVILIVCFVWEIRNAIEMPDDFNEHDMDDEQKDKSHD